MPRIPPTSRARIAVTGMDLTVSLGVSLAEVWPRLLRGESGIGPLRRFSGIGLGIGRVEPAIHSQLLCTRSER